MDRFARTPMPPLPATRPVRPEPAAIQGKRTQLLTKPGAGGLIAQATTLISARVNAPREWVITVMQLVKRHGTTPWQMTGAMTEGGATWVAADVTAPQLPAPTQALQLALIWAAGGASFQTVFDYPAMGGVFGVVADTLDLSVVFKADPTGTPYSDIEDVPVVGAFMVEGRAAEATSLRWLEAHGGNGAGASAFYTVKPYARRVRIAWDTSATGSAGTSFVQFLDAAATGIMTREVPANTLDIVLDVPAQAVGLNIHGANVNTFQLEWQIGLV